MNEVNLVKEGIDRHSNEEMIIYLSKLMNGVVRNYRMAVEKDTPTPLWASMGDIAQCAVILKTMSDKIRERTVASPK